MQVLLVIQRCVLMVDVTIRNVDGEVLRRMKIYAVSENLTIGKAISNALAAFLTARQHKAKPLKNFLKIKPIKGLPADLSQRIDEFAYED